MSNGLSVELPPIRESAAYEASLRSIPPDVFSPDTDKRIITPAGNTLICTTSWCRVNIFDPSEIINPDHPDDEFDDPTYRFTAGVSSAGFGTRIGFYIRNRNPLSGHPDMRHPDIHPAALALRALEYFRSENWDVSSMGSYWPATINGQAIAADNWRAYRNNLRRATKWWQRHPTQQQMKAAASRTKSGVLAARLGFPQVLEVNELESGRVVTATFVPDTPST